MGDGNEIVKRSDGEGKRLAEDRISDEQVEKNELVGSSDEAKDDEEEVFEEAICSQEGPKPQSSEAEDLTSYGKTESSFDVVENSEKATSNGSNLSAEDVSGKRKYTFFFGKGKGTNKDCLENEPGAQRNGVNQNASGEKSLNDSIEQVARAGTSCPLGKSSFEEKGETEGHNSSDSPGVTCTEHETVQNSNGGHDVQHSPQPNKELEKQQDSRVYIGPEIKEIPCLERKIEVSSSVSSTESRSNAASLPPARPAGLGRAAPRLEPVPRVPQQPRVNGNLFHNQPQQAEESTTGEIDQHDETREKLQLIRFKFLRLAHRLGQTPHNVVVSQVLYRLGLAEQLRGRNGSRVGAFSFDHASAMAKRLEATGQDPLDFFLYDYGAR
uniref:Uncharacterized protein n=1 Tax=Noccaea caerulescens TaxID=107243 RepID=A0A1J3K3H3_NOCCA